MYSFEVFDQLKQELNLVLLKEYPENGKFISTTKFEMECTEKYCQTHVSVQFVALLRSKKACCTLHRHASVGEKISNTKCEKNKDTYEENRKKMNKLGLVLVGDYEMDIKPNTEISYQCTYSECTKTGKKQLHTLLENKLAYCNDHHYFLHNRQINDTKREQQQDKYNTYNDMLDGLCKQYPSVQLSWNRETIWRQSVLSFLCINPNCKNPVNKLFQHLLQSKDSIQEEEFIQVYFGCQECKFYISESFRKDITLLKDTKHVNELVDLPKQLDYITTHSSMSLTWTCCNSCINCHKQHVYTSSPNYRFVHWGTDCPLCLDPNKCECISDGFICIDCKEYLPCDKRLPGNNCKGCVSTRPDCGFICTNCDIYFDSKISHGNILHGNICKMCKSKSNDDALDKIWKHKISNCRNICKHRDGERKNCDLDVAYLQELFMSQEGLCYISKMKLSLKVHSDFNISIERIDETKGYIKGNIQFICIEFQNGRQQWTSSKFHDFCTQFDQFQIIHEKDKALVETKYKEAFVKNTKHLKPRKKQQNAYNNIEKRECLCRSCDTIKDYERFTECGLKDGRCIECKKILNSKIRQTLSLRTKLKILVNSSESGITKRNKSKWRQDNPLVHTLTFEELLDIYLKQFGRCAYSNKSMELHGEYMMSLERKDTTIGYTNENCCLICIEFNTTDWSIAKCEDDDREGSSGWNKAKIKAVVENYLKYKVK